MATVAVGAGVVPAARAGGEVVSEDRAGLGGAASIGGLVGEQQRQNDRHQGGGGNARGHQRGAPTPFRPGHRQRPALGQRSGRAPLAAGSSRTRSGRAELEGLAAGERGERSRELLRPRHPRPSPERDDPDVALQGRLDLEPDEVSGLSSRRLPSSSRPSATVADQRQQDVARADRLRDHLDEVVARLDRVDVLEDLPAPNRRSRSNSQPAGYAVSSRR